MRMDKKYLIIFDWDGVIVDSGLYYFNLYRNICLEYNKYYPPKTLDDFRDWYDSQWENNVYNLGFSEDMLPVINDYIGRNVNYDEIHFFNDSKDLLLTLAKDYNLAIASTTPSSKIKDKLYIEKLDGLFSFISGGEDGKSEKKLKIKKVLDHFALSPENSVMVGDTVMDIVSADALHIKAIGIAVGLNSRKKLEAESPVAVVNSHKELLHELYRLFPV